MSGIATEATAESASAAPVAQNAVVEDEDEYLSISEIIEAYRENEVAAKKKFHGKTLKFKGRITDFGTSILDDEPYIQLDGRIGASFYFNDSDVVANLKKGDKVKLQGRIDYNLGSMLTIRSCKLLK